MEILGIDIGGSGVKAAVVDTKKGKLVSQKLDFKHLILSQKIFSGIQSNFIEEFKWSGKVGVVFLVW